MMADYSYPARTANLTNAKLLREQITALSLPGWTDFERDIDGVLHVSLPADLTATQKSRLDAVIAGHDPTQLTATQQAEITKANALKAQRTAASAVAREIEALPDMAPLQAGKLKPLTKYLRSIALLD